MTAILLKEVRDAIRSRWVLGYALLLSALGLLAAATATQSAFGMALQTYGRTTATLTNLCLLLAPLIALTMGSMLIVGERDRGTLDYLLAQPISRFELFLGKYLGLLIALTAATAVGFAPAGVIVLLKTGLAQLLHYLLFPLLSIGLISAMLGIGLLISVRSDNGVQAQGAAILVWFLFVLLYDLLLMSALVAGSLNSSTLAALLVVNPIDAARVLVVLALEPDLYLLGPAGALLTTVLGRAGAALVLVGTLVVWSVVPLILAWRSFRLRPHTQESSTRQAGSVMHDPSPSARSTNVHRPRAPLSKGSTYPKAHELEAP